jgi:uncharacterized protein
MDTTNPLALVTGASSGIGRDLAKEFVSHGFDVVIAAEDTAIHTVAAELQGHGTSVEAVQVDLATEAGVAELYARVMRPLDAAALNAGIGRGGAFKDTDLADEFKLIDLNVRGTVQLAKYVVQDMTRRGEGRILFTSSIASTMPGSFQAIYNASKSFVQSFAVALREELEDTGVTVTSLMPGPTDTEFFERGDLLDTKLGSSSSKDDPADVARMGFEALMDGEERVVAASLSTKAQARFSRAMPDKVKAAMHRRMAEPGSGD